MNEAATGLSGVRLAAKAVAALVRNRRMVPTPMIDQRHRGLLRGACEIPPMTGKGVSGS